MHPLLKRIVLNSLVAGSLLAVMSFGLIELARMWMIAQTPVRALPGAPAVAADTVGAISARVPLVMAAWGVAFVIVADLFTWFVLKRRPAPTEPEQPPVPDPAEILLEQLLLEAELKQALATTPAPVASENTRVISPAG
jgi:hypothetical protein